MRFSNLDLHPPARPVGVPHWPRWGSWRWCSPRVAVANLPRRRQVPAEAGRGEPDGIVQARTSSTRDQEQPVLLGHS